MKETIQKTLENTRFIISPESMAIMKELQNSLPEMKERFPQIEGVSFFGSRTVSKNRDDSDLDVRIFYNSEKNPENMVFELSSDLRDYFDNGPISKRLDTKIHMGPAIDISEKQTDKYLEEIRGGADPSTTGFKIPSRFFLGIGYGLYENRKYILDKLEKDPEGEKIWKYIIEMVERIERTPRGVPLEKYAGYPKTIEEARKYFQLIK